MVLEAKDMDSHKPIVFLLTQDLSSPSGLGRYFPMAKYLRKQHPAVTILALHSNFSDLDSKEDIIEGVKVKYVAQMHVLKRGNTTEYFKPLKLIWISLVATWRLFKACMRETPGLIVVGKPHPMNGIAGFLVRFFKNCRVIVDCDDYEAASNHYQNKTQQKIVEWFEDNLPRHADYVTTNTSFNQHRMIAMDVKSDKITYLPNGVELERFPKADATKLSLLRQKIGLRSEKLIGYIGSLNLKNHPVDLLIKALPSIQKEITDCKMLIVGGGKDLEFLQDLVNQLSLIDSVIFTGRVKPEEIYLYYQISDVSVDPVYDNDAARGRCPLKMFESWACGTPFLTMDVGDRRSLAGSPPAAITVSGGKSEELVDGLERVLDNREIVTQLIELGTSRVEFFTWKNITNRVSSIFQVKLGQQ